MKLRNIKFSPLFFIFILSYSFYSNYLIGQINLNLNGKSAIWPTIIITLITPFIFLFLAKQGEKLRNITLDKFIKEKKLDRSYLLQRILIVIYLLISNIFVSFYTIYFESMYFNNKYNVYFIALLLGIPLIIFSKKIIKSTFHLYPVNLIVYLIFFYLFFTNTSSLKYYTLSFQSLNLDNVLTYIILITPTLAEPFLLFYLFDLSSEKIQKRKMIFGVLLLSVTVSTSFLQVGNQFGVLLNYLELPFFHAWRNIYVNEYIENLDCINMILFILNCIVRLLLSAAMISKLLNTSHPFIPILFGIITLGLGCIFTISYDLFNSLKLPLLCISSFILIIILMITLSYILKLRGDKNA